MTGHVAVVDFPAMNWDMHCSNSVADRESIAGC